MYFISKKLETDDSLDNRCSTIKWQLNQKGLLKKKEMINKSGMLRFCNEHIYLFFNILPLIVIVVIYN